MVPSSGSRSGTYRQPALQAENSREGEHGARGFQKVVAEKDMEG